MTKSRTALRATIAAAFAGATTVAVAGAAAAEPIDIQPTPLLCQGGIATVQSVTHTEQEAVEAEELLFVVNEQGGEGGTINWFNLSNGTSGSASFAPDEQFRVPNALVEPGVLDSARCLSYLTIEHRGELPAEYHEVMGTQVYGCDICQEVCPYNQPAPVSEDSTWQPRAGLDLPRLVDLASRSDDELRSLIRGTPMTRAKVAGLRRNLEIALVNATR